MSGKNVIGDYSIGRKLGTGSFGEVRLAQHVRTGHEVAVKILNRKRVAKLSPPLIIFFNGMHRISSLNMGEKVMREINILKLFMHPHIIRLYEVIETTAEIFLFVEYAPGGELFDLIVECEKLPENKARRFFQQIISGVDYLHRNMVVHRDLKPENLLLDDSDNVKIADFGLSNCMTDGDFLKTSCGSPDYAAPEVISGLAYAGPEVDVWSCGVILYTLLCGNLPFDDDNIPDLFRKIKNADYTFPSHITEEPRDLISRMLEVDPLRRMTINEIRRHPWFVAEVPHYIAMPQLLPSVDVGETPQIDEGALSRMVQLQFDEAEVVAAVTNGEVNKTTIAYNLVLDEQNRKKQAESSAMLIPAAAAVAAQPIKLSEGGAGFAGSVDSASSGYSGSLSGSLTTGGFGGLASFADRSDITTNTHAEYTPGGELSKIPKAPLPSWTIGLAVDKNASEAMSLIYESLLQTQVRWKRVGPYRLECVYASLGGKSLLDEADKMVTFRLQLYKNEAGHLVDLVRVKGALCAFMHVAGAMESLLRKPIGEP